MRSGATRRALNVVVTAAVLALGATACPQEQAPPPATFTLLQANIGNTLLTCDRYVFKLCEVVVENALRDNIAAIDPDIIALQEVLPSCDGIVEEDARFVCHPDHVASEPSQLKRLLGDRYDVVCDERNGYECIAFRAGGSTGLGGLGYTVAPPVESDDVEECDAGFTVGGALDAFIVGHPISIINGHPQSGFIGRCRRKQLEQAFALAESGSDGSTFVLLTGDWNLDPFRDTDESADLWVENVGDDDDGRRFRYHSGIKERNPPLPTTSNVLFNGVLDHVASDHMTGSCVTLGEADGTTRLDGNEGAGCDHRALLCTFEVAGRAID